MCIHLYLYPLYFLLAGAWIEHWAETFPGQAESSMQQHLKKEGNDALSVSRVSSSAEFEVRHKQVTSHGVSSLREKCISMVRSLKYNQFV